MSNNTPSGDASPSTLHIPNAPEIESESVIDTAEGLKLPDPPPDGMNPFEVILWYVFTAQIAAIHLSHARELRVRQLGRPMNIMEGPYARWFDRNDDVHWRPVDRKLNERIGVNWEKACREARNLCAEYRNPCNESNSLIKAADKELDKFRNFVRGVEPKQESQDDELQDDPDLNADMAEQELHVDLNLDAGLVRRLHDMAADTTHVYTPNPPPGTLVQYVDMGQMAAIAGCKEKKTIARWMKKGKLPQPDIKGCAGKAHLWVWARVRAALAHESRRIMPDQFPSAMSLI